MQVDPPSRISGGFCQGRGHVDRNNIIRKKVKYNKNAIVDCVGVCEEESSKYFNQFDGLGEKK